MSTEVIKSPSQYLPTVRDQISDEDKARICTATFEPWTDEEGDTALRVVFRSDELTLAQCPLGLCSFSTNSEPGAIWTADDLLNHSYMDRDTLVMELAVFMFAWDNGLIDPSDLPAVFGYDPAVTA